MSKTRRVNRRKNRTYHKKGGKKNNLNMTTMSTQMLGGALGSPAPAPASVNYNMDYASVVQSLQTFGETVWNLKDATATGKDAANERVLAAQADAAAVNSLDIAAAALYSAFFGTNTTNGLFRTMVPAATFVPPPSPATR